jgi:glutamate--cysteine ligase
MDLDPFEPVGIGAGTIRFLDVFLLHCLLADSPPDTPAEIAALARNQHRAAERGREPDLQLERGPRSVTIAEWGTQLLDQCAPIAEALDALEGGRGHASALASAAVALRDPERLPSARVLQAMRSAHEGSHIGFVKACSERTKEDLMQRPLPDDVQMRLERQARESVLEQQRIEAADTLPFEEFRRQYVSPQRLVV